MPTTTLTTDLEIARPPAEVFAALTHLGVLGGQIGSSTTYRGTVEVSDDPVRAGSTYVDRTPIGRLRGEVVELEPDRRIVFRQGTEDGRFDVRITYELEPSAAGTRLVRSGEIATRGWLAVVHPIVVWSTGAENRRTMASLKSSLEAPPG
ncbi:MAG TPA: SRPBCC family protein [Candidatus Limnocylindria bacterium]|nr:SRPBCC family protein [Candidatus Limnocylindria bacterium]